MPECSEDPPIPVEGAKPDSKGEPKDAEEEGPGLPAAAPAFSTSPAELVSQLSAWSRQEHCHPLGVGPFGNLASAPHSIWRPGGALQAWPPHRVLSQGLLRSF